MDEICNAHLGPEIRAKYQQNNLDKKNKENGKKNSKQASQKAAPRSSRGFLKFTHSRRRA